MQSQTPIGVVIIGRNEGARLERCLTSANANTAAVVYVDSGSTDGSQAMAESMGAHVIRLDMNLPFTAARARNAGFSYLMAQGTPPQFVQFIDGDCEFQPDWMKTAQDYLQAHPNVAVVCGRRRERFPQASVYNGLIDQEWDTPIGQTSACGGDAMMRATALAQVAGFNPNLIAGEEPELCVRLRAAGWQVWRLDAEMTLHDADLTRFSQWWKRNKRAGFAFAEGAAMHGDPPERHGVQSTRSALFWGAALPAFVLVACLVTPWALLFCLIWPLQVVRLGLRDGDWTRAAFLTMGKFPEAQGALSYGWGRLRGVQGKLIEYK